MSATTETAPKKELEPVVVHHDSQEEYESAEEIEGEYDDDEDVEEIEIEEEIEEEEELEDEEDEEGDEEGEGKLKEKPLDDDEDRKNPQFIPKKGYFYEHDDRTKIEDETAEVEEEPVKKEEKPKKPADSMDKWSHDKFDDSEQAPKSREELTNLYGYDIRSEDQPPRARRRRRYGRGPTKYTRRWEEEEAYQKPRGGFRGRGGRGSSRGGGRDRRSDSKDEYEEDFPELGDSSSKPNQSQAPPPAAVKPERTESKSVPKLNTSAPPPRRDRDEGPPQNRRDGGKGYPSETRDNGRPQRGMGRPRDGGRDDYRESDNGSMRGGSRDGESNSMRGGRGGRGGSNPANRRGGRRNEFTNRNRYPNRRDFRDDQDGNEYSNHSNSNNGPSRQREDRGDRNSNSKGYNNSYENSRDRDGPRQTKPEPRRVEQKEYRMIVNGTANEGKSRHPGNDVKSDKSSHQQGPHQPQQHRIPPFTNTEYPAPSKANSNSNARPGPPQASQNSNRGQQNDRQHGYNEVVDKRYREPSNEEPPVRDLREKLNAMRMQKGYQNQNQNDRRNQMPPRMQQQQQQQQPQQQIDNSAKPRRYSTQREQRPVPQQQAIVTSGGMVIPNTVAPVMAGVPNMVPVVTMAEGVVPVPSTVAAYQPANYYEGTQVYEASGSPVTGSGPSVSPSLWNPHASAYATAPYPSPPTAPQVPQPPYADPTAFIGPGGPAIYAAPPQFLPDPTIINYSGAAPPFPPPYHAHPQGFQGYAQVTPAPPPEVYHGGVMYYNTQNQMQRPPVMPPQKRPKSVLQLVEPPEKAKADKGSNKSEPQPQSADQPPQSELPEISTIHESPEDELSKKLQETTLEPDRNSNPPPKEVTSWADEMELTSPTSAYPEGNHFGTDGAEPVSHTNTSSKEDSAKPPPPEKTSETPAE